MIATHVQDEEFGVDRTGASSMIRQYHDVQYFGPLFYVGTGLVSVTCVAASLIVGLGQGLSATALVLLAVGVSLTLLVVALGRMVVTVDRDALKISFGWLGLARARLTLDRVDRVRVCMLQPAASFLGWLGHRGLDGATCYSTQGRRGVEVLAAGKRFLVSSEDPQKLKLALVPCSEPVDQRPEYLRKVFKMPRTRRVVGNQNWGLLDPRKMRAISA